MCIVRLRVQCLVHDKHLIGVKHYHVKQKDVSVGVSFLFSSAM